MSFFTKLTDEGGGSNLTTSSTFYSNVESMAKISRILFSIIFVACPLLISAQELIRGAEKEIGMSSDKIDVFANLTPSFIPLELNFSDPAIPIPRRNNIFITQSGMNNNINARISSQDAIVKMDQIGERNNVQMQIEADVVKGVVVQDGNDNQIFNYVPSSDQPVFFDFKQKGSNHHIESYGSNSISNGLKLELAGDFKAIIIKNFKK